MAGLDAQVGARSMESSRVVISPQSLKNRITVCGGRVLPGEVVAPRLLTAEKKNMVGIVVLGDGFEPG